MTAIRKRRDVLLGTSRIALAAVLLAGSVKLYAADQASAPNTLTDAEKQAGWVLLFDGRTLGGWKASEDPVSFSVRDGMIVAHARGTPVKGQAGHPKCHLYYVGQDGRAEFTDFELRAEAKAERDSNGGIYFHTQFMPDNWPQKGMEVQINNLKTEKRKTGSLYAVADVADVLVPDNEWFQIDILVRGKRVTVALNGRTVVDWMQPENFQSPKNPTWSDRRLSSGTFALQAHDEKSVVCFRNLRVRPLDASASAESWVNPPQEPIPGVEHHIFQSASMQHAVGFTIYLPPGYAGSARRFPVVYYLHGMTDCESTHPQLFGILDRAIRAGQVPPMILVYAMCGRTSFYADSPDGEVMGETVFLKELIPHVDGALRTIAAREGRAVMGFSMGGAGALKFASKRPDLFESAVSMSGGFYSGAVEKERHPAVFEKMFGGDTERFDAQSPLRLAVGAGGKVPLRIVVGTKDPHLESNRQMKAMLERLKIGLEYEEIEGVAHRPPLVFEAQGLKAFQFHARHFRP